MGSLKILKLTRILQPARRWQSLDTWHVRTASLIFEHAIKVSYEQTFTGYV